jgi:Domain of unknown function (DUF4352)
MNTNVKIATFTVATALALGGCAHSIKGHSPNSSTASIPPPWSQSKTVTPPSTSESIPPNPSPPETMTALKVGNDYLTNTFSGTEGDNTEFSVTITRAHTTTNPPDQYSDRPANGYFVTFTIHAVNAHASSDPVDFNPYDFYVTVRGEHFDQEAGNAFEAANTFNATTLAPNEDLNGKFSFDIPARHGRLVYSPNYDSVPLAYWTF